MADSSLFIQSLEKGLEVLRAFRGRETLNLREIAQLCGITSSSAQRVAYTLARCGYLAKDARSKRYRVTVKTMDLGYSYLAREPLFQNAHAVLHQVNQECGEIVNLSVPDDDGSMVFVMRVPTSRQVPIYMPVGTRIPMHVSASGRAILAHMPPGEVERRLADLRPEKFTPHTTTDLAELRRMIEQARQQRYAYADEEFFQADVNVAAAVLDRDDRPVAAINISVPKPRWTLERARKELGPLVIRAARAISKNSAG